MILRAVVLRVIAILLMSAVVIAGCTSKSEIAADTSPASVTPTPTPWVREGKFNWRRQGRDTFVLMRSDATNADLEALAGRRDITSLTATAGRSGGRERTQNALWSGEDWG